MWGSRETSWDGQANKKARLFATEKSVGNKQLGSLKLCNFELLQIKYCSSEALVCLWCDVNGITYYRLIHPSFIKLNSNRIQLFSLYSVTTKIEIKRLKSTKYFIPVVLLHFFTTHTARLTLWLMIPYHSQQHAGLHPTIFQPLENRLKVIFQALK